MRLLLQGSLAFAAALSGPGIGAADPVATVAAGMTPGNPTAGAQTEATRAPTVATIAVGQGLEEALQRLRDAGLELVWSSQVIDPGWQVLTPPPAGADARATLFALLAPYRLNVVDGPGGTLVIRPDDRLAALRGTVRSRRARTPVAGAVVRVVEPALEARARGDGSFELPALAPGRYSLEAHRPGFVIEQRDGVVLAPGETLELTFLLQPAPLAAEEIAVHPSQLTALDEDPAAPTALSRDEILGLPHLAGDVLRAVPLLPGATANDVSAQFHVRGGRRDEIQVLLDGQELYAAYHLQDFDNAASIVPASVLSRLNLTTGAFSSQHGGRMGGVLDMATLAPRERGRLRLAASVLDLALEAASPPDQPFSWTLAARRGTADLTDRIIGREDPAYWDLLARADIAAAPHQSLRANLLLAGDRLDFREDQGGELTRRDTRYDSGYLWLTHQLLVSDRLFADSALSFTRADRDRFGLEDEEEKVYQIRDRRQLSVWGLETAWNLQASARHFLLAGVEAHRFVADYDYASERAFDSPFVVLRAEPRDGSYAYRDQLTDRTLGVYVTDRIRVDERLTLELGGRYDRRTLVADHQASPRASLAWAAAPRTTVRLGWGHYYQDQRAYELAVEDADTQLYPAERAEHWVGGLEHRFDDRAARWLRAARIEIYERRVDDPRPRYESLFEPFEAFPEGELDRYRVEPESSRARGIELFVLGPSGGRIAWWLNYALAESTDRIAGRAVPRQIDQRHALNVNLSFGLGRHWYADLAWRFHTGWPTTPVVLVETVDEEGETTVEPALGRLNSRRLPDYHRLDLRLRRAMALTRGRLTVFLDVQNLYDRRNVAGFDLDLDEETATLIATPEHWPGFFASAGVAWEW